MSASSKFGKFMLGAIVGGAVGAMFGMLLAPRSGAETREMIREEFENRTQEAAGAVREKSDRLKEKAVAFKEKVTEKISDVASDLEEAGRRTVSQFTDKKTEPKV